MSSAQSRWALTVAAAVTLRLLSPLVPAQSETHMALHDRLELTDHHGRHWSPATSRGKVVVLSFGYTSCPDVCSITLGTVSTMLRKLSPQLRNVQALFVSVDRERDTPERLGQYVRHFHPAIMGLTGSQEQLQRLGQSFQVAYRRQPSAQPENYTLDHTANIYVLDAEGKVARILPFGLPPEHLTNQVLALLPPASSGHSR